MEIPNSDQLINSQDIQKKIKEQYDNELYDFIQSNLFNNIISIPYKFNNNIAKIICNVLDNNKDKYYHLFFNNIYILCVIPHDEFNRVYINQFIDITKINKPYFKFKIRLDMSYQFMLLIYEHNYNIYFSLKNYMVSTKLYNEKIYDGIFSYKKTKLLYIKIKPKNQTIQKKYNKITIDYSTSSFLTIHDNAIKHTLIPRHICKVKYN